MCTVTASCYFAYSMLIICSVVFGVVVVVVDVDDDDDVDDVECWKVEPLLSLGRVGTGRTWLI